ncbi:MAG: hypothetical protein ACN4GM_11905 [Gammaproteobacteria bacterium]
MMSNLKMGLAAGLALILLFSGYSFGARKVATLESQIATLKREGDDAEFRRTDVQTKIDLALKEKDAEHAKQMALLKAESERRAKKLSTALAGAHTRVTALQEQVRTINTRRSKLVADMTAASSPAKKQKIQQQIDALDDDEKVLTGKMDANACLALAVPDAVIKPLIK